MLHGPPPSWGSVKSTRTEVKAPVRVGRCRYNVLGIESPTEPKLRAEKRPRPGSVGSCPHLHAGPEPHLLPTHAPPACFCSQTHETAGSKSTPNVASSSFYLNSCLLDSVSFLLCCSLWPEKHWALSRNTTPSPNTAATQTGGVGEGMFHVLLCSASAAPLPSPEIRTRAPTAWGRSTVLGKTFLPCPTENPHSTPPCLLLPVTSCGTAHLFCLRPTGPRASSQFPTAPLHAVCPVTAGAPTHWFYLVADKLWRVNCVQSVFLCEPQSGF